VYSRASNSQGSRQITRYMIRNSFALKKME
jgi:hypothetical protein